mgnify:CR=1 FL=1
MTACLGLVRLIPALRNNSGSGCSRSRIGRVMNDNSTNLFKCKPRTEYSLTGSSSTSNSGLWSIVFLSVISQLLSDTVCCAVPASLYVMIPRMDPSKITAMRIIKCASAAVLFLFFVFYISFDRLES